MSAPSLLLIQAGTPPEDIRVVTGELHHWFLSALGCPPEAVDIVKVYDGEPLPAVGVHRAAVITGSWSMVTDQLVWSETTAAWIRQAAALGMPLMGVCYGHQLMSHALGGVVDYHPDGREMGCLDVELLAAGAADPWLTGVPACFAAHLTHLQTVLRLPPGATSLASSAHDPHQIVRYSPTAVSVQFHPEFTADILAACITARTPVLRAEGMDPAAMLDRIRPTPTPLTLLRRFVGTYAGIEHSDHTPALLSAAERDQNTPLPGTLP